MTILGILQLLIILVFQGIGFAVMALIIMLLLKGIKALDLYKEKVTLEISKLQLETSDKQKSEDEV